MASMETDRIAREAARLLETGHTDSMREAIRQAAEDLGLSQARLPGHGRVRQHIRGMTMQAMGGEAYAAAVRGVMGQAEQLMTLLETTFEDVHTRLVGRASKGQVDGATAVHVRVYTRRSIGDIAGLLVEQGYEEPEFETAHTKLGRLDRMRVPDEGTELVVTRCLPESIGQADRDLFTGRPIESIDLETLRRRIRDLRVS